MSVEGLPPPRRAPPRSTAAGRTGGSRRAPTASPLSTACRATGPVPRQPSVGRVTRCTTQRLSAPKVQTNRPLVQTKAGARSIRCTRQLSAEKGGRAPRTLPGTGFRRKPRQRGTPPGETSRDETSHETSHHLARSPPSLARRLAHKKRPLRRRSARALLRTRPVRPRA